MKVTITIEIENEALINSKEDKNKGIIPNGFSRYARFFDRACPEWSKDSEYNLIFLTMRQTYANNLLRRKGYLFLNDVYDMLGLSRTKEGQEVGWIYRIDDLPCNGFVDFGLNIEQNSDFINGLENVALLDFNVDGDVIKLVNRNGFM